MRFYEAAAYLTPDVHSASRAKTFANAAAAKAAYCAITPKRLLFVETRLGAFDGSLLLIIGLVLAAAWIAWKQFGR